MIFQSIEYVIFLISLLALYFIIVLIGTARRRGEAIPNAESVLLGAVFAWRLVELSEPRF